MVLGEVEGSYALPLDYRNPGEIPGNIAVPTGGMPAGPQYGMGGYSMGGVSSLGMGSCSKPAKPSSCYSLCDKKCQEAIKNARMILEQSGCPVTIKPKKKPCKKKKKSPCSKKRKSSKSKKAKVGIEVKV